MRVNPWTCPSPHDSGVKLIHVCSEDMANSQWCSSLWNYIPLFRKRSKFIHWLFFFMSFTCMASISVADELILKISNPDLKPPLINWFKWLHILITQRHQLEHDLHLFYYKNIVMVESNGFFFLFLGWKNAFITCLTAQKWMFNL